MPGDDVGKDWGLCSRSSAFLRRPCLGSSCSVLCGQLLLGLINGSFYALWTLGLAVIFGMLNIINFTHGAQYMMGAFGAFLILNYTGLGYWPALIIVPIVVGIF